MPRLQRTLSRLLARYGRLDLLCLDELGYATSTTAAPNCSSRSSPTAKNGPGSPSPATQRHRRRPAPPFDARTKVGPNGVDISTPATATGHPPAAEKVA